MARRNIKNAPKIVDDLGHILAQVADLTKKADALKDDLREAGPGSYEGRLFRATVGEAGERNKYDAQAMRDKLMLEGFHAFVKAHTETVESAPSVRVVSKTGKDLRKAA